MSTDDGRRANGLETEHGRQVFIKGKLATREYRIGNILRGRPQFSSSNGSRCYEDISEHIEYATPEVSSHDPDLLVAHDLAGQRILDDLVRQCEQSWLKSEGTKLQIGLYRNNVSGYEPDEVNAFGRHENYQFFTDEEFSLSSVREFAGPLIAYLATRQLILGAGRLRFDHSGQSYVELGQRSDFIGAAFSMSTTGFYKPLINIRNEPHAGLGSQRLHVIGGDSNILPQLTGLTTSPMNILLSMRERGLLVGLDLGSDDQIAAAVRSISRNPEKPVPVMDRRPMTALEIQRFYFNQAHSFVTYYDEFEPLRPWINEWGVHIDRLARSLKPEDHDGLLDWATKINYLDIARAKQPDATPERLQAIELSMHKVNGPSLLKKIIAKHGRFSEAMVKKAMVEPPPTRAYVRTRLLQMGFYMNDWRKVLVNGEQRTLDEPLSPELPGWFQEAVAA